MFRGMVGKNTVKKLVRRDKRRSSLSQLIQSARTKEIRRERENSRGKKEDEEATHLSPGCIVKNQARNCQRLRNADERVDSV